MKYLTLSKKIIDRESIVITKENSPHINYCEEDKQLSYLMPVIDINPVAAGQYATINIKPKTYVYVIADTSYYGRVFAKATDGNYFRVSSGLVLTYNKAYSGSYLSSQYTTPSKGICIAHDYGHYVYILGYATSDTNYSSWDDIPNNEKVEINV